MKRILKDYRWKIVGVSIGAVAGFAYWYYIGCASGTCPIQSHWHTSMLYGGLLGYILPNGPKKKTDLPEQKENNNQ